MDNLLSLNNAARRIGVTSKWLRSEADAERIPYLRADSRYLFDVETLTKSLQQRIVNQLIETWNGKLFYASELMGKPANNEDIGPTEGHSDV